MKGKNKDGGKDKSKMTIPQAGPSTSRDLQTNQKNDVNIEQLEDEDQDSQTAFQIRPQLAEKFKPQVVRELIHNVLYDQFSSKKYNLEDAQVYCKKVADIIKDKLKDLKFQRYKYVVNVVLGEQKGAGVKMGTRCLWDVEADDCAYEHFTNETLFCVVCVYALFYY